LRAKSQQKHQSKKYEPRQKYLSELEGKETRGVDLQIIWGIVWQSDCSETNKLDASEVLTKHVNPQVTESTMERIWISGRFMAKTTFMI
jgi:hypothetical protein